MLAPIVTLWAAVISAPAGGGAGLRDAVPPESIFAIVDQRPRSTEAEDRAHSLTIAARDGVGARGIRSAILAALR